MRKFVSSSMVLASLLSVPMLAGCDRTLSEKQQTTKSPNGDTTVTDQKTVQHPDGSVTTEKQKSTNNTPNP